MPRPSPFALTRGRDDTALFTDARVSFSHLLPGRPSFGPAGVDASGVRADVTVALGDVPVTVRYGLERPRVAAPTAADVARLTASMVASARACATGIAIDPANGTWLAAWGVEAAAVAAYDVQHPGGDAVPEREELFVLVKDGFVMLVRWAYPRGFSPDPAYATFASVAEATMVWDAGRWQAQQHARVWPAGAFMGPGLRAAMTSTYEARAGELARVPLEDADRAALQGVLAALLSGAGAPWVPLSAEDRASAERALSQACGEPHVRAFVTRALADVHTAHDLRGFALLLGRAIGSSPSRSRLASSRAHPKTASSAPPPPKNRSSWPAAEAAASPQPRTAPPPLPPLARPRPPRTS